MPRRFLAERRRDPYYRRARAEGLRSRAAFKLAFLADRFGLLRPGDRVLDLGAAPGGWSVVAGERVGREGRVVAVDPRPIEPAPGLEVLRGVVGDPALARRLADRRFDLVVSDMSPRISGAYATDHARSIALVESAFVLAQEVLEPGGSFLAKVFEGDLLPGLERSLRPHFESLARSKPPASRAPSSEIYLVGRGFRGRPGPEPSGGG